MGEKRTIWTLSFTLMVLIAFCTSMFSVGLNNGITLYGERTGMSATESGSLVSIFMIAASLARLLTGEATDKHSPKTVFLFGAFVACVGCFMPLVNDAFPCIAVARVIQGLGFSFMTTASAVMLAATVPSGRLGEGMAYRGLGAALATAIGPSVAIVLSGFGDASFVFVGFGGLVLLSTGVGAACRVPPRSILHKEASTVCCDSGEAGGAATASRSPASSLFERMVGRWVETGLLPVMLVELFRRMVTGACTSFMVIYGMCIRVAHPSLFFAISSAAIVAFRLFGGKLFDTMETRKLLGVTFGTGIIGFLLLLFAPYALTYYAAGVFFGIVEGIGSPCLNAMTFRRCPESRWGTASASFYLTGDAGFAAGAFACGLCMDQLGDGAMPLVPICALLAAAISVLRFFREPIKDSNNASIDASKA